MMNPIQQRQALAAVNATLALGECIRTLGSVPSGHLYAEVMGVLTLEQYQTFVDHLKAAGLVSEHPSHLLVWIGPPHAPKEVTPEMVEEQATGDLADQVVNCYAS